MRPLPLVGLLPPFILIAFLTHEQNMGRARAAKRAKARSWWQMPAIALCVLGLAVGAGLLYRERYPAVQRCPPESDRFHEHCKEGRQHYLIKIDWDCLGASRARVMQLAFQLESDGDLTGVGYVPSWMRASDAAAVAGSPCILGLQLDRGCRYCKPAPKPQRDDGQESSNGTLTADTATDAEPAIGPGQNE